LRSGGAGVSMIALGVPTAKNNSPPPLLLDGIGRSSSYSLQSDRRNIVLSHIRVLLLLGCGIEGHVHVGELDGGIGG
jgi:hypothetical protein